MAKVDVPMYVRIPADVKAAVAESATRNMRCFSAEMVYQLCLAYGLSPVPMAEKDREGFVEKEKPAAPVVPQPAPVRGRPRTIARAPKRV
jgi:hypothetical protein